MKSNDPIDDLDREQLESVESLEDRLRKLPPVGVPCGLEAKLIAAIPQQHSTTLKETHAPARFLRWAMFSAAAILVFVVALVLSADYWSMTPVTKGPSRSDDQDGRIAVTLVNFKETDPCNILPPLPDWR